MTPEQVIGCLGSAPSGGQVPVFLADGGMEAGWSCVPVQNPRQVKTTSRSHGNGWLFWQTLICRLLRMLEHFIEPQQSNGEKISFIYSHESKGPGRRSSWRPPGQEVGGGLVAGDPVAPPERSSVGQSQEDAWVDQGGEGGVEVLLQALLQPALLRKLSLKKK